jgi:hypothetical protein
MKSVRSISVVPLPSRLCTAHNGFCLGLAAERLLE